MEQGYTTYTCDCGDSYVDDYTDAVGHADKDNNGQCDGCEFAFRMGDVNGDGRVTVSDVARTNDYVKGVMTLTAEELLVADVNADGQVDDDDILHLSNEILGKGHVYEQGACTICGSVLGDMDLGGEVNADDLTVLD